MKMANYSALIEEKMYLVKSLLRGYFVSFLYYGREMIYMTISILCAVWLVHRAVKQVAGFSRTTASTPDLEKPAARAKSNIKAPERPPGVWNPVSFQRPRAPPYPQWDIQTTNPLPYRPFRHGQYHITMGLRSMKWDEWIELDNHFPKFHADKARRINERGEKCCKTAPEAFDGAVELLEEL